MRQYFWHNCFDLRFKIDIVVMIPRSRALRNKCCVQPHLFASYMRLRRVAQEARTPKWLSTAGNCYTAGGFSSSPIPVRACAEQLHNDIIILSCRSKGLRKQRWYFETFRSSRIDSTILKHQFRQPVYLCSLEGRYNNHILILVPSPHRLFKNSS